MTRLSFEPLGDSWTLVAAILVAMAAFVWASAPKGASVSRAQKRVDGALRALILLLFAVLFARPSAARIETEELPASVYFLCDLSESMTIQDVDGARRFDAMRALFENARETTRQVGEKFETRVFGFGDGIEELEFEDGVARFPDKPTGGATAIGDALESILRDAAGKRAIEVFLLTDGAQRSRDPDAPSPQDVAMRFRDRALPISTLCLGSSSSVSTLLDASIADLRANDRVFVGNEFVVSGQARAYGLSGREATIELSLEQEGGEFETVDRAVETVASDDATIPYKFHCKISTPGVWKLRVSTPILDGELLETNNELEAFVEAVEGGAAILYVEGTRRVEQNFLRAAVNDAPDLRLRYWRPPISSLVGKSPDATEAEMVAALAKSRKSLVDAFFADGKYAAYVLGDVDSTAFQPNELKALAERVENGSGLVVLAGERSFGLGGYADTPLRDAFPFVLNGQERLPLDGDLSHYESTTPQDERARLDGAFKVAPRANAATARDANPASLSVDPQKNAALWRELPPLADVYRLGAVKPGATVLLDAVPETSGEPTRPLLVAQRFGLGRVAVVATDSTWRWRMRGKEQEHAKFWRQLLLWAAKLDDASEGELTVEVDGARFAPGELVPFQIAYRPKQGERLEDLTVEATLVAPNGDQTRVPLTEEDGVWKGKTSEVRAVGDYRVEASATSVDDANRRAAQARFLVADSNLELERPNASPETTAQIASISQGAELDRDSFQTRLEELLKTREKFVDRREVKRSLYDSPAIFAAFVALASILWALRKKWGAP